VTRTRDLIDIIKILLETSANLTQRANTLLDHVSDDDPEQPTPLTATVVEETSDDTHMTALLTWDNSGSGHPVTIDWGPADTVDDEEPATGTKTYQYLNAGQYVVTVTDLDDPLRTVGVPVTVPFVTGV
jgi:hypothetical protein